MMIKKLINATIITTIILVATIIVMTVNISADDEFDFSNDFNSASYSINQVSLHNKTNDCWIIVNNKVYGVTAFMNEDKAEDNFKCGKDNTLIYFQVFDSTNTISKYYLGNLNAINTNNFTVTGTPQASGLINQNNNPTGISLEIVKTHTTNSNCWVIVFNKVYDITSLIPNHANVFVCGSDNTATYQSKHGTSVTRMASYYVGELSTTQTQNTIITSNNSAQGNTTNTNTVGNTQTNTSTTQTNTSQNNGAVMIPFSYMSTYHNTQSSCWIAISNKVYDITSLISTHANVFVCGSDNTAIYQSQHGTSVTRMASYYIGELQTTTSSNGTSSTNPNTTLQNTTTNNNQNTQNNNSTTQTNTQIPYDYMSTYHNTQSSCWIAISGKVYDITSLISTHANVFTCGVDNTAVYQSQHGTNLARMTSYYIGDLASGTTPQNATTSVVNTYELSRLQKQIRDLESEITDYEDELSEIDSQKEQIAFLNEKIKILEKKLLELNINPHQEIQSKLNFSLFEDDDGDGILNKNDIFPGENDYKKIDSDNDTISDYDDTLPGKNDLEFQDVDSDGILDINDSDLTKDTDKDNDGIDDSVDDEDNRGFLKKLLSMIGLSF